MAEEKTENSPSAEGEKKINETNSPTKTEQSDGKDIQIEEKKIEENNESEKVNENDDSKQTSEPKSMRAIVLNNFGSLKNVKVFKKPEPTPSQDEVLIKVKICGLNFQDLMVRRGTFDLPSKPPFIMGSECAGEIEMIGEGVTNFKVGDRVVALPDYKGWAELVTVPETAVFKLPENMSYSDAAAITMNYVVAYIILFDLSCLTPGKSLLVHSAGGGVGQAVVQLAKTVKDVKVFGVCSKSKHEELKSENNIDYLLERGSDYCSEVRKVLPEGVDIVLDCMYGEEYNKCYSLLKPMGRYILYGSNNLFTGETKSFFSVARSWWQVDKISPIKLFDDNKTITGFNLRHLMHQQGGHSFVKNAVDQVFKLWADGYIKPKIDSTWALENVTDAMQKMHDHKNIGKIVLDLSLEPKIKVAPVNKGKVKDKKNANQDEKQESQTEPEENEKKTEAEPKNDQNEDASDNAVKENESS
ncbi:GSCOCG00010056001-RA-CDS [Cotesia congregata]|uniref:Similar to VAT1L: Synaptic vesicle membrane protein VAT-1 homolog-like (Homo sapiens) n=1 Tax=Cotesia congregata TaxID=51543 RepID=A0A8J2HE18_COTCN|nr:GSCOCG00010056001-RA-CDS [Cotesia congregata]CAG5093052.1 Similar to VAT1L: Synaptic vesicle membrane protein VAT-1 homolog-like (Homo sapiens) [Cotesia congregata]